MKFGNPSEFLLLLAGDVLILFLSLWLALLARFLAVPSAELFSANVGPFAWLFFITALIFLISGLYDKHTALFKEKLPERIFRSQIANAVLGIAFFYFVPTASITPKRILFFYIIFSSILLSLWHLYGQLVFVLRKRERAILIGSGAEYDELSAEIKKNAKRYDFTLFKIIPFNAAGQDAEQLEKHISSDDVAIVITDTRDRSLEPLLPALYALIHRGLRVINFYHLYEQIFDRIPLSVLGYGWAIKNSARGTRRMYDFLKRVMDCVAGFVLGFASLVVYPFVILAIKLDDGGPIFIVQERIGQNNKTIRLYKFRSMKTSDGGRWQTELYDSITRVGRFLRATRIDELPQLWSVFSGDLSLIGPRPDIVGLGRELTEKVPYYSVRTIIKPGLSGWAQIKQDKPPHSVEETKLRLSYDLYYIKHRSLVLDVVIALKTIKTLLSRAGK